MRKTIKDVIEQWLESESPYENEQARVLLKFISKLRISNDVLLEWITRRPAVYHQASDILLEYIAEQWSKPQMPDQEVSESEEEDSQFFCSQPVARPSQSEPSEALRTLPTKPDVNMLAHELVPGAPTSQQDHLAGLSQGKSS